MAKRGRPRKVGLYDYWLKIGNPSNMKTERYDTDTEVKRAAQKHVRALMQTAERYDRAAYGSLVSLIQALDDINEGNNSGFNPGSFSGVEPIRFHWSTQWGDFTLRCNIEIWRVARNA